MSNLFTLLSLLYVFLPGNSSEKKSENYYPKKQIVATENLSINSDYIYSTTGTLLEINQNNKTESEFFVKINELILIKIDLNESKNAIIGSEIGYLARILAAESLTAQFDEYSKNTSMFTKVCIAETIRNRKYSNVGYFANYKTYRDVILYTGYATNAFEFTNTQKWLKNQISMKRFTEELLPAAIFVFFNETDFTNNAIGFFTPAKMSDEKTAEFYNIKTFEIQGIDPFYEFTFWKF